jgi:hypothetical protein
VIQIPQSHRDLVEGPYNACLSTVSADGRPYSAPAWCLLEGETPLVLFAPGAKPESLVQRNMPVSLLVYDPRNPLRNMEIRGHATYLESDCPPEGLDRLTRLYSGRSAAEHTRPQTALHEWPSYCIRIIPERVRVEGGS